jgi:hypothetical protein
VRHVQESAAPCSLDWQSQSPAPWSVAASLVSYFCKIVGSRIIDKLYDTARRVLDLRSSCGTQGAGRNIREKFVVLVLVTATSWFSIHAN